MTAPSPPRAVVDDTTAATPEPTPLGALWARRWFRWPLYALVGMIVLQIVETIAEPETEELLSGGQAGAMLRWAVPLLLAGLGGLFAERSGIVNIGLEGMMVLGTWFGAWGSVRYGPVIGTLIGLLGGALGGLLHAVATVSFGVNHIISAVAINIMAPGVARFLADEIFTGMEGGSITQSPRADSFGSVDLPVLDRVSWLTLIAFALVPLTSFVLWRTRFGLRLRSCGEYPTAGDSLGVNVHRYQYAGVIISGALAGLAGSYIVTELTGIYREGQTNGRGFIGIATMIFGNWRPGGTALGALLFGYADGLQLRDRDAGVHALLLVGVVVLVLVAARRSFGARRSISGMAIPIGIAAAIVVWYLISDTVPTSFNQVTPHILTLVVLVFSAGRLRPPKAAGLIWRKGDH
jgi:general nucleoside transport system permease protein